MKNNKVSIALVGDLVLDEPDADYWLAGIAPALQSADLAIGHLEVPHTACSQERAGDVPAPGAPPENLGAIARAGIGLVSTAGNHIGDCGAEGIDDTLEGLRLHGIRQAGCGANLRQARAPAIMEVRGVTIAMLSYNCVGPEFAWADERSAGCAFLPLGTRDGSPVSPRADLESVLPSALEILEEDMGQAREAAEVVLVALHKGVVHTPAKLAPYERPIAHAAIEAGADAVLSHHAHIVRGIEFHAGKPIFHGLGNGCVVTRALSPSQDHPQRREWAQKRREMFGFEPDPRYTLAPFHPEAVNAFIGTLAIGPDGDIAAGLIPVDVLPPGRPVLAKGRRAREIADYVEGITLKAGLPPIRIQDDGRIEAIS
ncbi:poly-gamma-glutamate synthesis protein (capsule biosynthesis protein) [Altererythrobacter atlanticus]|uniref:Capsule biosynthesis protein CapA n=1 Tax=Croceibacterium atlanticum TaxID=1267766 RepID=A0A0F7KRY3_9SPHN|nr:CapA family protein [Croceibacterium atlanticum]AKH41505.1 Capsule biosynthesis protein CapA [Croceibacterium atlanticum]MBB5732967.1 poly-gamma-glutamate synthesis protein (capsule biosynthesis protein) [Croceibacterium atlanticum]